MSQDDQLERRLAREADAQAVSYGMADYAEGLAAIKEKRKPVF
jgi:hypothetical protein